MNRIEVTDQNLEIIDRLCLTMGCRRVDVLSTAIHTLNAIIGYRQDNYDTFICKNSRSKRSEIMNMPGIRSKV